MIPKITFSKRVRISNGLLVITIPQEIQDEMELSNSELVEIQLTKKPHVDTITMNPTTNTISITPHTNVDKIVEDIGYHASIRINNAVNTK